MIGLLANSLTELRRPLLAAITVAVVALPLGAGAFARGPEKIADVAESVVDAVVNISTSQTVNARSSGPTPQVPPGSPFEEFFEEFFKNRRVNDLTLNSSDIFFRVDSSAS